MAISNISRGGDHTEYSKNLGEYISHLGVENRRIKHFSLFFDKASREAEGRSAELIGTCNGTYCAACGTVQFFSVEKWATREDIERERLSSA